MSDNEGRTFFRLLTQDGKPATAQWFPKITGVCCFDRLMSDLYVGAVCTAAVGGFEIKEPGKPLKFLGFCKEHGGDLQAQVELFRRYRIVD